MTARPRRDPVALRVHPAALAEVDRIAAERNPAEPNRSDAIRYLLRLGLDAYRKGTR